MTIDEKLDEIFMLPVGKNSELVSVITPETKRLIKGLIADEVRKARWDIFNKLNDTSTAKTIHEIASIISEWQKTGELTVRPPINLTEEESEI